MHTYSCMFYSQSGSSVSLLAYALQVLRAASLATTTVSIRGGSIVKYLIRPRIHLPSALIVADEAKLKDETIAKEERR
jgi:hypothetical protein